MRALVLTGRAAACWLLLVSRLLAQADINPTGDPKLAPERMLAVDSGGHTGGVYRLIQSTYGDQLISVGLDKTIRIWDLKTGAPLQVLRPPVDRGAHGYLYAASLSPDGTLLAVAGYRALTPVYDHRIRIISLADGQSVRTLKGHVYSVFDVAFSPDGKRLASGSLDSTARIWDEETGESLVLKGHTNGVHGVAWSPDGKHLVTGSLDGTGRIWNTATGASEAVLDGHRGPVMTVAWSPDGRTVATGCDDRAVRLFEPSGKFRYAWQNLGNEIESIAFSPDSMRVLYTFASNRQPPFGAGVLSMTAGLPVQSFGGHANGVISSTILRDGKTAVTGDSLGGICLWDMATGRLIRRLQSSARPIFSVGWSPNGRIMAWGNTNLYPTSTMLAALERTFSFETLEFGPAPDASYLRAQHARGGLLLRPTGERSAQVLRGGAVVSNLAIADPYAKISSWTLLPDGKAALGLHAVIAVYDAATGRLEAELYHRGESVHAVAPSPDDRYLLAGGADQIVDVWSLASRKLLLSFFVAGDEWIAWSPEGYYAASLAGENLMGWHVNHDAEQMASFYPAARFHRSLYRPDIIRELLRTGDIRAAHAVADATATIERRPIVLHAPLPPEVRLVIVESKESKEDQIELQATATSRTSEPIGALELLVDGRPWSAGQSTTVAEGGGKPEATRQWSLTLPPGRHQVVARADTDSSYGLSNPQSVGAGTEQPAPGALYVLAVGIGDYAQGVRQRPSASKSAKAIVSALSANAGELFSTVSTRTRVDRQASRKVLKDDLAWLKQSMKLGDVGIVLLSGAATSGPAVGWRFVTDDRGGADDGLSATDVRDALAGTHGRLLLLVDAQADDQPAGAITASPSETFVRSLLAADCGVAVLTSTSRHERAEDDAPGGQSLFAQALVDGVAGRADLNRDSLVYDDELGRFVAAEVARTSVGRQHPRFAQPALVVPFAVASPATNDSP